MTVPWKGWRPNKKTPKVIGKLEEIFKIDWTIAEACSYADIDPSTYHDWMNNDKEFSDKMTKAQDYAFIEARKMINKAIKLGDWKLALDVIRKRDKRYTDKSESLVNTEITIDNKAVESLNEMLDDTDNW